MKRLVLILILSILVIMVSGCKNDDPKYVPNYNLEDIVTFSIHHDDYYPVFMTSEGQVFLLGPEDGGYREDEARVQVLFGNYDSTVVQNNIKYKNITDQIPLDLDEDIIKIIDYYEGWLFLTNHGNVYKVPLRDNPEFRGEYYIAGRSDNIIQLEENEKILDMYVRTDIMHHTIRFVTNTGNEIDLYEDSINVTQGGFPLFDDSIFDVGETSFKVLHFYEEDKYIIITSTERVLEYNPLTGELFDVTENFPLEEDEKIIGIHYSKNLSKYYTTNKGRIVFINLSDYSINDDYFLDVILDDNEEVVMFQYGKYSCREGMILIKTSLNNYYYFLGPDKVGHQFDPSNYILLDNVEITDVQISSFATHSCGTSDIINVDGNVIGDFEFVITVNTTDNHTYLLGRLDIHYYSDSTEEFLVVQIK